MNWNLIKKKYPKAYDKLFEMFDDGILETEITFEGESTYISDIIQFEKKPPLLFNRVLYDFFDEQGIYGEITLCYTKDKEIWFEYHIDEINFEEFTASSMDEPDYDEPYKTKTRTEAEEQMFLREFEILESKWNTKN